MHYRSALTMYGLGLLSAEMELESRDGEDKSRPGFFEETCICRELWHC